MMSLGQLIDLFLVGPSWSMLEIVAVWELWFNKGHRFKCQLSQVKCFHRPIETSRQLVLTFVLDFICLLGDVHSCFGSSEESLFQVSSDVLCFH